MLQQLHMKKPGNAISPGCCKSCVQRLCAMGWKHRRKRLDWLGAQTTGFWLANWMLALVSKPALVSNPTRRVEAHKLPLNRQH